MKDKKDKTSLGEVTPGIYEMEGDRFIVDVDEEGNISAIAEATGLPYPAIEVLFNGRKVSSN
jgi:hypothetical protein